MKEKLLEMLKLQEELDTRILNGKEYPTDEMQIGLFVELGELMNELPTQFKHWKKSAIDNREKALEELTDCFHFALSLEINGEKEFCHEDNIPFDMENLAEDLCRLYICDTNVKDLLYLSNDQPFNSIYSLMIVFGFTFDEVYEAYIKKNEINHVRQDEGY